MNSPARNVLSRVSDTASGSDPEAECFNPQQFPPQERGVTFEALYFRQLQLVTNRIHEAENVDQLMLEVSHDICRLFNAARLTLYAVNDDRTAIISKVKTGLNSTQDLKLPISAQSIAGYVATSLQMVNIADAYDVGALKKIHPSLNFLQAVDKRSGYRTKQMLVAPVMDGDKLHGVLQVINNRSNQSFTQLEEDGVQQLCKTLAIAIRQRPHKAGDLQRRKARL
jgi:GAF domain-containing protein